MPRKTAHLDKIAAEIEERRPKVLKLRKDGYTMQAIADSLGVAVGTVASDIKESLQALHTITLDHAEVLREQELQRIDALIQVFTPKALAGDAHAADRLLRFSQERSKLLGLYEPEKIDSNVTFHVVDDTD